MWKVSTIAATIADHCPSGTLKGGKCDGRPSPEQKFFPLVAMMPGDDVERCKMSVSTDARLAEELRSTAEELRSNILTHFLQVEEFFRRYGFKILKV